MQDTGNRDAVMRAPTLPSAEGKVPEATRQPCLAQGGRPLLGAGLLRVAKAQCQGAGLWDALASPPAYGPISLGPGLGGTCA